ncbi:hypothetical protein GCM10008959_20090 [Deinococcus seoulensis]|uniref:Uncharacterized protein n=1 Tax=Deinococcus seoulensis TaxID=1837379 RepID=A0ABQ2RTK5_9DEIO|nr:hypothetical protein GCM10008959_20090 [Deinococcus seoulensis]
MSVIRIPFVSLTTREGAGLPTPRPEPAFLLLAPLGLNGLCSPFNRSPYENRLCLTLRAVVRPLKRRSTPLQDRCHQLPLPRRHTDVMEFIFALAAIVIPLASLPVLFPDRAQTTQSNAQRSQ